MIAVIATLQVFPAQADIEIKGFGSYIYDLYGVHGSSNGTIGGGSLMVGAEANYFASSLKLSINGTHSSGSPSDITGDLQVLSNIDVQGEETLKFYELIFEQNLGYFNIGFGWKDLSTDFNILDSSLSLVHSTFGTSADFGNTGFNGPSIYPFPSFGLHFSKNWKRGYFVKSSLVDPLSSINYKSKTMQDEVRLGQDNFIFILEFGQKAQKYKYNIGVWEYQANKSLPSLLRQSGIYLDGEYSIEGYTPFIKLGVANQTQNLVESSISIGINKKSTFCEQDEISLGYVWANITGVVSDETVFEAQYKMKYLKHFYSALSYQRINNTFLKDQGFDIVILRFGFDFEENL